MGMSMIMMGGGQRPIVPTISGLNVSGLGGPQRPQKIIKVINFGQLMNQQQEKHHKK
jgi:hypothetical protein